MPTKDTWLLVINGITLKHLEKSYIEEYVVCGQYLPCGGLVECITWEERTGRCLVQVYQLQVG